jgi:hypothetical protein
MSWDKSQSSATDPIERASCHPDFLVLAYPALPKELHVTAATPRANETRPALFFRTTLERIEKTDPITLPDDDAMTRQREKTSAN